MDEKLIKLGNCIRFQRLQQKLSQEQLVEKSNSITAQHLSKIEKGQVDMRVSTLFAILKALNCKLEDLIDLSE